MTARLSRWERLSEWPLTIVAAVFLGAYSWLVLSPPRSRGWHRALELVDYAAWAVFAVDYVVRVAVAEQRPRYFARHLPDLAVVALPLLRPLRLLRLVLLLRAMNRWAVASLRGRVAVYVTGAAVLLIYTAALAALDAERHHAGAQITTFGRALWWAFTTVSTVGYGDYVPVTVEGRIVAVALMIGGVAIISAITGSFASWLIDRIRAEEETARAVTTGDVRALLADLETHLPALVAREVEQLLASGNRRAEAVPEVPPGA
jgi:voltage-gated potassium channel